MNRPHRQQGSVLSIILLLLIVALGAYIGWQYSQKNATPVVHEETEPKTPVVTETIDTQPVEQQVAPEVPPEPTQQAEADEPSASSPSATKTQVVTEAITDIIETTTSEVAPTSTDYEAEDKEVINTETAHTDNPSDTDTLATTDTTENTVEPSQTPETNTNTVVEETPANEFPADTETTAAVSPVIIDKKPESTLPIQLRYKDHFQPNRIVVLTVEIENNTAETLDTVTGDVVLFLENKEIARLNLEEHDILADKNKASRYQLASQQSKTWGVEIAETRLPALYDMLSVTPVKQFQVKFIQAEKAP